MEGILAIVLGILQPVVLSVAALGLATFRNWIASKTTNEEILALMKQVSDAAMQAVQVVYQTLIDAVKKKQGGVVSEADKRQAAIRALAIMKTTMGPQLIEKLKKEKGLTDANLDAFLTAQIESAVYESKKNRPKDLESNVEQPKKPVEAPVAEPQK